MKSNRALLGITLGTLGLNAQANTDPATWLWVDSSENANQATSTTHNAHFTRDGTPISLTNINERLNQGLLESFYAEVPEGVKVRQALLDNTFNNISVKPDFAGTVAARVSFLNEGAGYRNSLGYFLFPTATPPTADTIDNIEHVVIFPNASKQGSGGGLTQGDQVDLKINIPAGYTLGFFIASNHWNGWYGGQKSNFLFDQPFYTLPELNPTVGLGNKYHVIFRDTLSQADDLSDIGFFAYGFEDIKTSGGDKDFNDLIFHVEVTPYSGIDNLEKAFKVTSVKDTQFAKQGKIAFEDNWPVKGDYDFNDAVIAYDLTKIVTTQEVTTEGTTETVDVISSLAIKYDIEAIGATYRNGIGLTLPNITLDNIESLYLTKIHQGNTIAKYSFEDGAFGTNTVSTFGYPDYTYPLILESEDNRVIITLAENLFEELSVYQPGEPLAESVTCMFNTSYDPGIACPTNTTANSWELEVTFKQESDTWVAADSALTHINYDHFMFATEKGNPAEAMVLHRFERIHSDFDWFRLWQEAMQPGASWVGPGRNLEIHLSEFSGTQWFESAGSFRDLGPSYSAIYAVDADLNAPFNVTDQRLPWVLDLPIDWLHPVESRDMNDAYPTFVDWLTTPELHTDWYKEQRNNEYIYSRQEGQNNAQ